MARVLIVEDDPDTREMLGRFLEFEGFDVRTAENGERALEALVREGPASLILLDLMMPVMDGWEFRRRQAEDARLAGIPVVVVTAAGPRENIPPIDAQGWLSKPVDLDRLLQVITPLCGPAS